jgi:hypothetical protein
MGMKGSVLLNEESRRSSFKRSLSTERARSCSLLQSQKRDEKKKKAPGEVPFVQKKRFATSLMLIIHKIVKIINFTGQEKKKKELDLT